MARLNGFALSILIESAANQSLLSNSLIIRENTGKLFDLGCN